MHKSIGAAIIAAVSLALMCGCAGTSEPPAQAPPTTASADGVRFTGPWAADFAQAYRDARNPDEKEALKDGKITDAEFNYFEGKIGNCLSDLGVKNVSLTDGQWHYSRPDSVPDKKVDACMKSNGIGVMLLKDSVETNPNNVDEEAALVACLVRKGAVPKGYTLKDYKHELAVNEYSFDLNSAAFSDCNEDPLAK